MKLAWISLFGLSTSLITFIGSPAAIAATVTATGTDPSICNQSVSDATNVTALRLAGGDCVISFKSGTVTWSAPANLKSVKMLLVGGGGGGGGSYDTAGAGGGGAGQVLLINNRRISPRSDYTITVGAGGAAGFHIAQTNSTDAIGRSGDQSKFAFNGSNIHIAYPGSGGSSSRATAPGTTNRSAGAAATLSAGGIGGGPGGGGFSGGSGGGSSGAGNAGSTTDPGRDTSAPGGAGTPIDISGASITYGVGGAGGFQNNTNSIDGTAGSVNTGNGGGGASVAGSTFKNGGAGGSGIVIIRYGTTLPIISALAIAGNSSTAVFRSSNSITATVNVPALVTFYAGRNKIAGCISVSTTGTSPNNVATCSWKPTIKGAVAITAEAAPIAGLAGSSSTFLPVSVIARSAKR